MTKLSKAEYSKSARRAKNFADVHAVGSHETWRDSWAFLFMGFKAGYRAALQRERGKR